MLHACMSGPCQGRLWNRLSKSHGIRPSQQGFGKGNFYIQVNHLVDEGKAVDVVCPDFSKAFDAISQSILLEKLASQV